MRPGRRGDDEQLCALAFIKRRFARCFADVQVELPGQLGRVYGWPVPSAVPSVSFVAAAPWLAQVLARAPMAALQAWNAAASRIASYSEMAHVEDDKPFEIDIRCVKEAVEKRRIVAFSFSSVKFEGRAPEGKAVVRVFMGGALQPEIARMSPEQQTQVALEELRALVGITGEPLFSLAGSHQGAMAQYHVGHLERVAKIRELARPYTSLAIAGNGFDGVGIPDCIRNANESCAALLKQMNPA